MMSDFLPLQSAIGGLFIGAACGVYMLSCGRIAGNSGVIKSLILGPEVEPTKVAFLVGLLGGGAAMGNALPSAFMPAAGATPITALAGLAVGLGTALANGCTSGHGLCGLSRLSLRSLVAVPTFMIVAIATATARSGTTIGPIAPIKPTPEATVALAKQLAGAFVASLAPLMVLPAKGRAKETYLGLWTGACFAVGLSIGGMVRSDTVTAALSPARFDGTLWVLFVTALLTTFAMYRLAERFGRTEASALSSQAKIDAPLVIGSALFGFGWGLGGVCPGPHLVCLGASPTTSPGLYLMMAMVCTGMWLARPLRGLLQGASSAASIEFATVADIKAALMHPGATIVDLRPVASAECRGGMFKGVVGSLSAPWDRKTESMPTAALPEDKATPLIVYCYSGKRAAQARTYLKSHAGYSHVLNAGGPGGPPELLEALGKPLHTHDLGVFEQLFDGPPPHGGGSSTYTYLLGDAATGEAILIDPVLERVDADLAIVDALGLKLTLALNTHCHADHITGTGELKKRRPGVVSVISAASGAKADRLLAPGEVVSWASGRRALTTLATPGHTNGCVSFHDKHLGAVFTGDALLIGGCGRTDFQEGSAATLHTSVHTKLFNLPSTTLVLPAHDYKGRCFSTVQAEREGNPRLTKDKAAFVELMANLELPYPKKIDASLPANLMCGL